MKKIYLVLSIILVSFSMVYAKKITITNINNAYSPDSISVAMGDTILFDIHTSHNALEVSKATYDSNGNTGNGGFNVPYGGGEIVLNNPGTYYYVCVPHAALGMKGIIVVSDAQTSVAKIDKPSGFSIYPNPAQSFVNIKLNVVNFSAASIKVYNLLGNLVKEYNNVELNSGFNNIKLEFGNDLPEGKYVLQLNTGSEKMSQFLIVK